MTDKQILDEVYRRLVSERENYRSQVQGWLFGDPLINFIEEEWQKQDDIENTTFSKHWYMDVSEMEKHRGLEIGEDGTVKSLE
tara:strand:- start:311 stop:559 length:249 start_codon:yes stop_codon:yes gene_type:complete